MTALLRLSVRLARKEELASTTVQSLSILLAMKPGSIFHVSRQVRSGIIVKMASVATVLLT